MDHTHAIRSRRSATLVTAALLVLALVAGSCSSSTSGSTSDTGQAAEIQGTNITVADPGPPQSGGTLRFGLNAETDGWSPLKNQWAGSAYIVAGAIFDRLAQYGDDRRPHPYLAESMTSNADFTEWTITMRPGVTFHNGQPCDAAAVKKNLDAQRASVLTGSVFSTVSSIEVVDDLSVKVTMSQPWSTFPDTMATQVGSMAAPAMLDAPDGGVRDPIGTGPFVFDSWVPDNKLVVKKNPNYWRQGYPLLDEVDFQVLPDLSSRSAALQSGTVDVIEMGDPTQILRLSDEARAGKLQMYTNQGITQNETFTALNVAAPPFDDPLARQIVAYGTDRDTLSASVYQGVFTPALGPYSEDEPAYTQTDMPTFDKDKAKQLADEYQQKYGKPLEFSLLITPQPEVKAIAESSQQQFADIGVKLNIKPEDQATLVSDVILGNYQATGFILFGSNTIDVNYVFLHRSTVRPVGGLSLNFTRNDDPVLSQALDDARKTDDPEKQNEQFKIVQEQLAKDLNMIFVVHDIDAIAYTNQTHGLVDGTFPDGSPLQVSVVPLLYNVWKS